MRRPPTTSSFHHIPPFFRQRDLEPNGISRGRLDRGLANGEFERVARGVYRRTDVEATAHETVAQVCARVPRGIVCLLTALAVHDLGTQSPPQVWIAIDRKARKPVLRGVRVRLVRFSRRTLTVGVIPYTFQGVPSRITTPARTLVDCFRYRNKIGLDVALEALQEGLRSRSTTVDELFRTAKACRVAGRMRPYLEAISA